MSIHDFDQLPDPPSESPDTQDPDIKSSCEIPSHWEHLLEPYYEKFYLPIHWEPGKKAKNYFAKIKKGDGDKTIFDRKFINSSTLDTYTVYRQTDFEEDAIVEQRAVFVKGAKSEITFGGFFVVHFVEDQIYGEPITQKDALEYFDCKELVPEMQDSVKNKLRVKIGTVVRKLAGKYGDDIIAEILGEILTEYFQK